MRSRAIAFGSRIVRGSRRGQTVNRQGANKSRDGRDRVTDSSHWSVGILAVLAGHSAASPDFPATGQPVVGAGLVGLSRQFPTRYPWLRLGFSWRRGGFGCSVNN